MTSKCSSYMNRKWIKPTNSFLLVFINYYHYFSIVIIYNQKTRIIITKFIPYFIHSPFYFIYIWNYLSNPNQNDCIILPCFSLSSQNTSLIILSLSSDYYNIQSHNSHSQSQIYSLSFLLKGFYTLLINSILLTHLYYYKPLEQ